MIHDSFLDHRILQENIHVNSAHSLHQVHRDVLCIINIKL